MEGFALYRVRKGVVEKHLGILQVGSVSRLCLVVVAARPMLIAAVIMPKQKMTFKTRFVDGLMSTPHKRKTGTSDMVISMQQDRTIRVSFCDQSSCEWTHLH